jgi:hypothetical protein
MRSFKDRDTETLWQRAAGSFDPASDVEITDYH